MIGDGIWLVVDVGSGRLLIGLVLVIGEIGGGEKGTGIGGERDEEGRKSSLRWVTTGSAVTYGGVLKSGGGPRKGLLFPSRKTRERLLYDRWNWLVSVHYALYMCLKAISRRHLNWYKGGGSNELEIRM